MIDNLHMLLVGIWICHHYQANTTTLAYHNLGSKLESLVTALGAKSYFCVFETLNPHGMVPTSTPDIKGNWQPSYVFDGDMDLSSCRYHHTCLPWLGRSAGIFGHCWAQNDMAMHCGWGSKPTWNDMHIHFKYMQGDWQTSYAVDGDMDPSSSSS